MTRCTSLRHPVTDWTGRGDGHSIAIQTSGAATRSMARDGAQLTAIRLLRCTQGLQGWVRRLSALLIVPRRREDGGTQRSSGRLDLNQSLSGASLLPGPTPRHSASLINTLTLSIGAVTLHSVPLHRQPFRVVSR